MPPFTVGFCKKIRLCLLSALFLFLFPLIGAGAQPLRLAFWNVENLFLPADDLPPGDEAFTPQGSAHWTWRRFSLKRDVIYKTIVAMDAPLIVGLAEVENDKVLEQLTLATPLRQLGYGFVHFDSPDQRGIDCALLYREKAFVPFAARAVRFSDSSASFFTRDLLLVGGTLPSGDTLFCFVNHWPSQLGGVTAYGWRSVIRQAVERLADSILVAHPTAAVVVMGDFNSELRKGIGEGSYKYQGAWGWIDHIFVFSAASGGDVGSELFPFPSLASRFLPLPCRAFDAPWLLVPDDRYLGQKPFRTYAGPRYLGGVSDHLPVYLDCEFPLPHSDDKNQLPSYRNAGQ